ncbi:hypothetical protein [Leptospira saintgironsiae]|uniref:Uncharacterized protein n=1 Tax=Leptospira saintgironsiae TaxID=2023183 RepID=A0A2M9YH88_9LEPT|nr:hypothetical protein [Leptospira saintgironsiae]PJZ50911.1 hypothetical protein CH362_03890 [Leptospira saintgironsiae]
MNIVLVFRRKILGYGFACEEGEVVNESKLILDRLDRYLVENHIPKKRFTEKYERFGKVLKGFIGFLEEDISFLSGDFEEVEIETGKYLKFGNSSIVVAAGEWFYVDKRIQTYLEENNIRTDWMRFSSGKNSYLRIIN